MAATVASLDRLVPGQPLVVGADRVVFVDDELAAAFRPGDAVIVDPLGNVLHIAAAERRLVADAVAGAVQAFGDLARCTDDQISDFFERLAALIADDAVMAPILAANAADVERTRASGRSTTRLVLTDAMRAGMVAGLRGWAASDLRRHAPVHAVEHSGWRVDAWRAPLGVVGFVFEGRPNVFADAAGVVRSGNTAVLRIGSDALATAEAIAAHALGPALAESGLPPGTMTLVRSPARSAGWALFADERLSLAVARGSGPAVAQLGAVARQAGVPVSLHGTGGAWLLAAESADEARFQAVTQHSLDRKVCNTLNVCCIVRSRAETLVPLLIAALDAAASSASGGAFDGRLHATSSALEFVPASARARRARVGRADGVHDEPFVSVIDVDRLGHEFEWESSPELAVHVVAGLDEAIGLCNRLSPRFVVSLVSAERTEHDRCYATLDAPFVGDGFTRWVDGQYALDTPELGLSNWQGGRLLARGAILSGDSVHTVRFRATMSDPELHR